MTPAVRLAAPYEKMLSAQKTYPCKGKVWGETALLYTPIESTKADIVEVA